MMLSHSVGQSFTDLDGDKTERNRVADHPSNQPVSLVSTYTPVEISAWNDPGDFYLSVYSPASLWESKLVSLVVPSGISETFGGRLGVFKLIQQLKRLRAGWDGPDSCAPEKQAIKDIEVSAHIIDELAKKPACEIEEDGSIKLSWSNRDNNRKLVLTFRGKGRIVGSLVTTDGSPGAVWKVAVTNEHELSHRLDDEKLDEILS
ncbi:MAG: hypothetical protein NXI02_03110 [Rhodobacteraceae bacterium]|nr:hypothetical protein [Paracoccaceae bacterium]